MPKSTWSGEKREVKTVRLLTHLFRQQGRPPLLGVCDVLLQEAHVEELLGGATCPLVPVQQPVVLDIDRRVLLRLLLLVALLQVAHRAAVDQHF